MSIPFGYVATLDLQEYLVDKTSGLPLAGGLVYFYRDAARTELKPVYELTGNPPDYTFSPLPNPVILSAVGTFQDNAGNDIIPYYYPYILNEDGATIPDLYFVAVFDQYGNPQFTRQAWPPNVDESPSTEEIGNIPNFIPNGQFLVHNTIEPNGLLGGGSTPIAQGGWTVELPDSVLSTNTASFEAIPDYTLNPPASPPFKFTFSCIVPNSSDAFKDIQIKFNNVNNFASDTIEYSFGFWIQSNAANTTITVDVVKYFGVGGSVFTPVTIGTVEVTAQSQFISISGFVFGDNSGYTFGTGDTYIGLQLAFSTSQAFSVSLTDSVLTQGNIDITDYPVQTNADTVTRSIFGWTDIPNYSGFDLYLPAILTAKGMIWDYSQVGDVGTNLFIVPNPNSTSPVPQHNKMPTNGDTYLFSGFSANGIPYARLGEQLVLNSPVPNVPLYGTGLDFVTAYINEGINTELKIVVNSSGSPISGARDGNTGWGFFIDVTYNNVSTGSNSLGYTAYSNVPNTLLAVGDFYTPFSALNGNTSGFIFVTNPPTGTIDTSIVAQQFYSFSVLTTPGSALVNISAPGKYWSFSNSTTNYYMWFFTGNGETDPAIGGRVGIKVTVDPSFTAQDVANIIREAMNAYQITTVVPSGLPLGGQYWLFSANPSAPQNYYVWYVVAGVGIDPMVPSAIGIPVSLVGTEDISEIVLATQIAINTYQYASPNFDGMFLRMADFNGIWDLDVAQRWSMLSGLSGANVGTFEFQQLLTHEHAFGEAIPYYQLPNDIGGGGNFALAFSIYQTQNTGGSETRPVNAYVCGYVRY